MINVEVNKQIGMLYGFAESIGAEVKDNGILEIPKNKGKGYLRGLIISEGMGIMIRNYELDEDMLVIRKGDLTANERIIINFNNIFSNAEDIQQRTSIKELPFIQITKGKIDLELLLPKKTKHRSILIAPTITKLIELLGKQKDNNILNTILEAQQDLVFEEIISPAIQKTANDIIECDIPQQLQSLYFRIKAEEIICLLFAELLKRENSPVQNLNEKDVITIYKIRNQIINQLDKPPILKDLAKNAGFSETKLKCIFKQIFGNSIFNYYQSFRMKEAARLLKEKELSVSEVGYLLGFSNLSHFSKIFEEHIGMKPKKYSVSK